MTARQRLVVRCIVVCCGLLLLGGLIGWVAGHLSATQRLEWWTSSPNDLGAVLASFVLLVVGALPLVARSRSTGTVVVLSLFGLALVVLLVGLVGTCSRGAYLAALGGLILLGITMTRVHKLLPAAVAIVLLCAIASSPRSSDRIAQDPRTDGSVTARYDLLTASAVMLADAPGGLGDQDFAEVCERWYLHEYRGVRIWHPLNDALWLGTRFGILVMAIFLAIGFALLGGLTKKAWKGDLYAGASAAALLAMLIAGSFTGLLRPGGVRVEVLIVVALAAIAWCTSRSAPMKVRGATTAGAMIGLLITVMWFLWGTTLAHTIPYLPTGDQSHPKAMPRNLPAKALVAVVMAADDQENAICRTVARPLIECGYTVTCLQVAALHAWPAADRPHILLYLPGTDHDVAALAATRAVVVIDPRSSLDQLRATHLPVLYLHGQDEPLLPSEVQDALLRGNLRSANTAATVAHCWPRLGKNYLPTVCTWMDALPVETL